MKIKEILKNKWGWVGAIILILVIYMFLGGFPCSRHFETGNWECSFTMSNFLHSLSEFKSIEGQWYSYLLVISIGFASGLILEKLWRKFK